MSSSRPHQRLVRTSEGENAWRFEQLPPDSRWLLGVLRHEQTWGDVGRLAIEQGWDAVRLDTAVANARRQGWIRWRTEAGKPFDDGSLTREPPSDSASSLENLLHRYGGAEGDSNLENRAAEYGGTPPFSEVPDTGPLEPTLPAAASEPPPEVPAASPDLPWEPQEFLLPFERDSFPERSPEKVDPVEPDSGLPPRPSEPSEDSRFDESAVPVVVSPVDRTELLRAMGLTQDAPAPLPPQAPAAPTWSGKGGLEELLAALEAPLPETAVPAYTYGGQAPAPPPPPEFPRLKDAPGLSEAPPPAPVEAAPEKPRRNLPPELLRQQERLRREEADRQAARQRLADFKEQQTREKVEADHQLAQQRMKEENQREKISVTGLSDRLRRLRERQERS